MVEPLRKKPKIARGADDYLPGNITEIELSNFMTFDHVICKPGTRLNLVIGPNGSGKSSIVCAIALCLGGEPQLLGRATSVGAYVKRGENAGFIKITLRGNAEGEQMTIMRKIDTQNKSEWLFNGKVVPKKEVLAGIKKFNIQVNNLTQFLPQDRVCEFAKLTPVQLLEETEKAIGDPKLPVQHQALVEKSRQLKKYQQAVERNGATLKQLIDLNAELEKDVERVRQREELLAKAESMKKKLPWLKYDMKKAEYIEAKKQEKVEKKKLDQALKSLDELKEPIGLLKKKKGLLDSNCKDISKLIDGNIKKRTDLLHKENEWAVKISGIYKEKEDVRRREESRQQKFLEAIQDLEAAKQDLLSLPKYEYSKEEMVTRNGQIKELRVQSNEKRILKSEMEKLRDQKKATLNQCLNRLKDMENINNKRLLALRNSGAENISQAYEWVQQHRNQFNKEVYGPVLLEVNVSDQVHANYLEGQFPYYIWKSFITQDARDRDFLVKNLKSFDVPVLNYERDRNYFRQPLEISEQMHVLGIYSRLDQVFDAPDVVKEVLTSQFYLDKSYIGSKETDQRADKVKSLDILDLWTPENHYRWVRSRYDDHISANVEAVRRSNLLFGVDGGETEKLRSRKCELENTIADMDQELKSLQTEERKLDDEAARLQRQHEEVLGAIRNDKQKHKDLSNRVDQRQKKVDSFEKEDDLDTAMAKLIDQTAKHNADRLKSMIKIKDLLRVAVSLKWDLAEKNLASIEYDAKIRESEANLKEHQKFAELALQQLENCQKEVESHRQQLAAAKRHAESIAVITPELEKSFLEMPDTVEELKAAIEDSVSEANNILFLNQNILQEYEHRQQQIEDISTKLEADKKELGTCLTEIDVLKESWLPTLRNLVAQINETFSRKFQEMAVAGEVLLDEHGTDFDQFGILIKVKFRQSGQLQVLSAHHQSGGERSVSTILYLVSLQDLTNCPFRVVDEINQGMDPINERKMFQQLVRAASQPNTPQCFLLTPKLLPNLEYSDACSVLTIMNGPYIDQPSKVWSTGENWSVVAGLVG